MTAFSSASSIGSRARWTRRRTARGSSCQAASTSASTSAPSGSSATAADVRAGEQQMRALSRAQVLGEAGQDTERILEAIPPRHLREQRGVEPRAEPLRASGRGGRTNPTLPSSRSNTARCGSAWLRARPAARSTAVTLVNDMRLVLGRERVDRRRDDHHARRVEPLPRERLAREHVGVGLFEVRDEEPPRLAREVVGKVEADVRPPDERDVARRPQPREHPGGLRVVEDHDVTGSHGLGERLRVRPAAALVGRALSVTERAPRWAIMVGYAWVAWAGCVTPRCATAARGVMTTGQPASRRSAPETLPTSARRSGP